MPLLMTLHTATMKFSQSFVHSPTTERCEESPKILLPTKKSFIDPVYTSSPQHHTSWGPDYPGSLQMELLGCSICIKDVPEDPKGCTYPGTRLHITELIFTATTKLPFTCIDARASTSTTTTTKELPNKKYVCCMHEGATVPRSLGAFWYC